MASLLQKLNGKGLLLQEMRSLLEPMGIMFASKGYKVDDVVQEVRRMQSGWQHSDYRAWLKHYTTGKRPRSVLEDSKQLLRRDGADNGAGPRDMSTGWDPVCLYVPALFTGSRKFALTTMLFTPSAVSHMICVRRSETSSVSCVTYADVLIVAVVTMIIPHFGHLAARMLGLCCTNLQCSWVDKSMVSSESCCPVGLKLAFGLYTMSAMFSTDS